MEGRYSDKHCQLADMFPYSNKTVDMFLGGICVQT